MPGSDQSAANRPRSGRTQGRRAVVDERDRELLEFLAEHRVAIDPHVQRLLGIGPDAAARRLRRLHGSGLLDRRPIFDGLPYALTITRAGLGAIGSRLPVPHVNFEGYRHDVGVAWLWLAARAGAFGAVARMRTDRSMRSHDGRRGTEARALGIGIGMLGPRGGERLHYPDLLLTLRSGHRAAIELELTTKSRARIDQIMLGYAGDGRIDAILYLVPDRRHGRPVLDAARRAEIAERVQVQLITPGSPAGAPQRAGQRARAPARRREVAVR